MNVIRIPKSNYGIKDETSISLSVTQDDILNVMLLI